MNAGAFVMAVLSLFWSSQKQDIESDPAKWAVFAFPREEFELTLRVPDKYIPVKLQGSPLRPVAPDDHVTMLMAQYDYGRPDSAQLSQTHVGVALSRLSRRPPGGLKDGLAFVNAMSAALKEPPSPSEDATEIITVQEREWLWVRGESSSEGYDSFYTLIGLDEILVITGFYRRQVVRDKKWLASRRQMVREVLEQAILTEK